MGSTPATDNEVPPEVVNTNAFTKASEQSVLFSSDLDLRYHDLNFELFYGLNDQLCYMSTLALEYSTARWP